MRASRAWVAVALAAAALAPAADAAPAPVPPPRLDESTATARLLAHAKAAGWVARYPEKTLVDRATYDPALRDWTVKVWSEPAGQIALGRVDDLTGAVEEAWTGPQVAWTMARGKDGAFGGKAINSLAVWLGLCLVFLVGLADLRRPFSVRNLDLLVLASLSVSLWFFNDGRIFWSVPLVYPVLAYVLGRMLWIALRRSAPRTSRPVWPVWLLLAATIFLGGFRVGLAITDGNVIDVGYSGIIGAQRIASGQAPYGHFPVERGEPCAPANRDGRTVYRIQANGRCESANEHGDTYGPVTYEAYLPAYAVFGWKGKGDDLRASAASAILFDVLCLVALGLAGLRYGGRRLAVTLAFSWSAYPFTAYVMSSGSNDSLQAALLVFAFLTAGTHWARGGLLALAAWAKFGPLALVPLWATYPDARRGRGAALFAAGFVAATVAAFAILLLEPRPLAAVSTFWERTIAHQFDRESPFSLWDWRQYHAGLPDLHLLQRALQAAMLAGAVALAFLPRRKSPLQLAALTAALVVGFQIVLTHWFYLYVVWFFPFCAIALLWPEAGLRVGVHAERLDRGGEPGLGVAVDDDALETHAGGGRPEAHG